MKRNAFLLTLLTIPISCDHFSPRPGCGEDSNATFCESQEGNYPNRQYLASLSTSLDEDEKVVLMVNSRRYQTVGVSGSEKFQYVDVASDQTDIKFASQSQGLESPVCGSMKSPVFPKKAQSADNKWRFIFSDDRNVDYQQVVMIEKCLPSVSDEPCAVDTIGHQTVCRQQFVLHKLLALDENGHPYIDSFHFPHGCICHKVPGSGLLIRHGNH